MSAPREIITLSRGHRYRRLVEYRYDPKRKRTVPQVLANLGPIDPVYRRPQVPAAPEAFPCTLVQFGLLATYLINGTLTALEAVQLIGGQALKVPPETLEALGVRTSFTKKTPSLEFLLWRSLPSSRPRRARSARPRGRSSTGGTPPTS